MQFATIALAALAGLASAQKVHVISVSNTNNSLVFSPDNVKADVGDMLQFQFRAGNHSVVQSNFDNPCSPIAQHVSNATGIFSGYQPVAASQAMGMIPTYTVMVNAKTPMWFYCSQGKHCQAGMVMVVNENTAANSTRSLSNFKQLAKAATANVAPSSATGGSAGSTGSGSGSTGSGSGTSTSAPGATATAGASSIAISGLSIVAAAAAFFAL